MSGTARYIVLDSNFCVLKALIKLCRKGIFVCAFIEKKKYWPKFVPNKEMESHIKEMDVGDTNAIKGKMDGFKYNIWDLKESNCAIKMMATGGSLFTEGCKSVAHAWDNATAKKFHYTQPYDWH